MSGARLRRVLIADATGIPESRHLGLGLLEAGFDVSFHTSCEFGKSSPLARVARLAGARGERLVARRRHAEFDELSFRNWLVPDLLNVLGRRRALPVAAGYRAGALAIDLIARGRLSQDLDLAVLRQGGALHALRRARALGVPTVLLSGTPDPREERELVAAEERRLHLAERRVGNSVRALERTIRLEYVLADAILVGSELGANSICRASGRARDETIIVLPRTCDPVPGQGAAATRGNGRVRVLFVGSVNVRKGVHHLVRAVRDLAESGRAIELDVIGSVRDAAYGRLLARELGPSVRMRGPVARPLLPAEYLGADVLVLPSLSDGFGMVVPEAKACGLPVITTDRCGAPVRDGEDGLVVPAGDTAALREALRTLVDDPVLRKRMGQAALASAGDWTWADYRKEAVARIESALAGRRR